MTGFKFIDLFAGVGGFHFVMAELGGECVYACEIDKYACRTYEEWHGIRPDGDITLRKAQEIPDHDVLCAGFPCQPFSIAGVSANNSLKRPHGFEDKTRGTLFFYVANILRVKRPAGAILENVKNLRHHDKGKTWRVICDTLDEVGYNVYERIIDAQHWGVPQHRERTCIVCIRKDIDTKTFAFPEPSGDRVTVRQILDKDFDPKHRLSDNGWRGMLAYRKKHEEKGNGYGYQMAKLDGIGATLLKRYYKDGSEVLIDTEDGGNPRRLTPREAMRYMGYLDDLPIVVSDTQMYIQMGNSIVPGAFRPVARTLIDGLGLVAKQEASV